MTERLHTRFYYVMPPYYSLMKVTREDVGILGASLAALWMGGGPPWSQMGDKVCLDTDEIGPHDREIAYY